jgi:hypothetical protein
MAAWNRFLNLSDMGSAFAVGPSWTLNLLSANACMRLGSTTASLQRRSVPGTRVEPGVLREAACSVARVPAGREMRPR